jgi:amino acid permease
MTTDVHDHPHEQSPLITHASIEDDWPASSTDSTFTVPTTIAGGAEEEEPLARLQFHASSGGAATVVETMTNLAKTCMGTGCLALPFAAKQGGLLLTVFGLVGIAFWNAFASRRLSSCWDMLQAPLQRALPTDASLAHSKPTHRRRASLIDISALPPPPRGTATLGKVAWYALGPTGLFVLDSLTVLLLLGIIVAYNDAIRVFLQGTPFTTHSDALDAVVIALLIAPLSVVPDMGYLTKTSATGLAVLGITLLVVAAYGIFHPGEDALSLMESMRSIPWFPVDGLAGASQWFGCCVFGFGIVPLTFNFRESMAEPAKLSQATTGALLLVAFAYIAIGLGMLVLYPNIQSDILSELPEQGLVPVLTRLAMVVVVMATSPLLIVPCGEILEGKLSCHHEHDVEHQLLHEHDQKQQQQQKQKHRQLQIYVRFGICFVTVAVSVGIPEFVSVLTFVGCFCVAFVSFCIPPCLHLVLRIRQLQQPTTRSSTTRIALWTTIVKSHWSYLWLDILFLALGLAATGISTAYVFRHMIRLAPN